MRKKDWRGVALSVGAHVLYTTHMGTNTWVTEAEIVEVKRDHLVVTPIRSTRQPDVKILPAKLLRLKAIDRVTVLSS